MNDLITKINDELVNLVVRKIFKELTGAITFLSWPPLAYVVEICLRFVVLKAYGYAELFVTDKIVDNAVKKQVKAFNEVTDRLIEYEEKKETMTQKEKDELDEDLMDKYRALFQF